MEVIECDNCGCLINIYTDNYSWVKNDNQYQSDNILCEDCAK